ncbi:MAG: metallophosphoesterase family protein, partial [Weeksellaceae bacterium]
REPRQKANLLVSKLKPHAVLFGGDMTNRDTDKEWQEWMDDWQLTIAPDGRMFPIVAARGNHENASVIYELFDTPNKDSYFALTFGDDLYRFYTLNTLISVGGTQKNWLEKDLKENQHATWRAAQYHFPMRPHTSRKFENIFVYNAWANVFYNQNVSLVVECDSHTVKTTYPIKPSSGYTDNDGFVRDNIKGTVYTGEGCWGAPLRDNNDDKAWTQASGKFNQFKLIFVDEDKIELRTIKVDNAKEVAENPNNNIFNLPTNLQVWQMDDPDKTEVVYIYQALKADYSTFMPNIFRSNDIKIQLDFASSTDIVKQVTFKAINQSTGVESYLGSTPEVTKSFNATLPSSGNYKLISIIERNDGESITIEKNIYVGDFSADDTKYMIYGNNDINERENGSIILNNSQIGLGYSILGGKESMGLRFEDVRIPHNAVINEAYIQFTPSQSNNNIAEGLIQIENTSNSQPFTETNAELRDRTKATEELIWRIPSWIKDVTNDDTTTPNLKKLVQTIINRRDWEEGNSVTFSIQPYGITLNENNANRSAYAYEYDPELAPKLIYNYTYNASDWVATAMVTPGVGINTDNPKTPLDVNGLMRSSVRNAKGELFECNESIEGALGYDHKDKNVKVCIDENGTYHWKIISF